MALGNKTKDKYGKTQAGHVVQSFISDDHLKGMKKKPAKKMTQVNFRADAEVYADYLLYCKVKVISAQDPLGEFLAEFVAKHKETIENIKKL